MRTKSAKGGTTEAMWEMYSQGATLEEVGNRYGLTREGIRMRFKRAGYQIRTASESMALRPQPVELLTESLRLWTTTLGTYKDIAQKMGISQYKVERYIKANTTPEQRFEHHRAQIGRSSRVSYTDEELLEALRICGKFLGQTPGIQTYNSFVDMYDMDLPHSLTIIHRFASWNEAIIAAGFTPHDRPEKAGLQTYSEEDCESAVRRVAEIVRRRPSMADYSRYRLPDDPSGHLLRHRYGGWINALDVIL